MSDIRPAEPEARGMICSSEDGDWYAFDGGLTREAVLELLAWLGVEVEPDSKDPFALTLGRGHIAPDTCGDECDAECGEHGGADFYIEVGADVAGARPAWIVS